ncbi:universal stress protein [Tahibacter amnicola]|uniref:Universal stress protein n=1 Tax=Tahibacter amnicola TaxID=2976241 RepID=A0ABY6BEZ5_9GAMM|nr:universal stress protein [Tahibacter amnicola]UXI66462.1 universal stress protein [Tahibacter amnicola]
MKLLLAVDGSEHSKRAVKYVLSHWRDDPAAAITVLNVDPPLMRRVANALGREDIDRYHADNAEAALRYARTSFKRAGIAIDHKAVVGDPAAVITRTATQGKYDLVVMGSHGRGVFGNLLLGSVVTKVLSGCQVPVLIVR